MLEKGEPATFNGVLTPYPTYREYVNCLEQREYCAQAPISSPAQQNENFIDSVWFNTLVFLAGVGGGFYLGSRR